MGKLTNSEIINVIALMKHCIDFPPEWWEDRDDVIYNDILTKLRIELNIRKEREMV